MSPLDLLLLAFKGVAVASLPLAGVWLARAGDDRLRRLAWVTAFFTFDLVVFGGFTRLTDSGLGCPDWPGCYAKANPFMAAADIRGAEAVAPLGPVTMAKAWIEMIHRYLAMGVGVLIVAMLVMSVVRRRAGDATRPTRPARPGLASALLGLVLVQGAFGAWTVTQRLQPIFVTTHLLLGLALLGLLVWHAQALGPSRPLDDRPATRVLASLASAVLVAQIALGGWVSANYAVVACTDFPTCRGDWLPAMDFANGFHPWRQLGMAADGGYLSLDALTAIHWTHRTFAAVVVVVLALLAWRLRRTPAVALALVLLLAAQGATGLVNVVMGWPLVAAVLHNAGAAGLIVCLAVINYRLFAAGSAVPLPGAEGRAPDLAAAGVPPYRQRPV